MLVLGFLAVLQTSKFLARRTGIHPDYFINATFLALAFGVLGSRLSHVLENWQAYWRPNESVLDSLRHMVNLREGGLTYYGGFLLATVVCIAYGLKQRLPLRFGMDIVAVCLMVGLGFGRIGCYFNGCCHGPECSVPWSVTFPYHSFAYEQQWEEGRIDVPDELVYVDRKGRPRLEALAWIEDPELRQWAAAQRSLPVHPSQIYSAVTAFLLAGLLFAYFTLPHAPGRVFALVLMLEGATRYLLEMLRTEPPVWGPMTIAQVTSVFLVAAGIGMWIVCGKLARRPGWEDNRWARATDPMKAGA
jgi:phosphatidylglycerol---prolipoprotein diacylglyceryl transferase